MTREVTAALLMLPQPLLETVVSVTPEIRQAGRRGNYAPSMTLCKTRQIKLLATTQNAPLCSYPFCLFSFKAQRKERVILVYLNDFLNSIPLQEVSGVTQREAIASFLASVVRLVCGGSRLLLSPEPAWQGRCAPWAAPQPCPWRGLAAFSGLCEQPYSRQLLVSRSPFRVAGTSWSQPNNDKLMSELLISALRPKKGILPLM